MVYVRLSRIHLLTEIHGWQHSTTELVCTWHVDRAWMENLRQLKNSELQTMVYHNLRLLLEETHYHKFELLLDQIAKQLIKSSTTANLGKCFQTYYTNNKEQWAGCYRKKAFVNTNMYVEYNGQYVMQAGI